MEFDDLLKKINSHHQSQLPFVVYMFPESETLLGSFQEDDITYTTQEFERGGFVFSPFAQEKILLIPNDKSIQVSIPWKRLQVESFLMKTKTRDSEERHYLQLVQKALEKIRVNNIPKIVTSRKVELPLSSLDFSVLATRLFSLYPKAFRYLWFHPDSGLWMGATPEVLLKVKKKEFSTMALAGTQRHVQGKEPKWTPKEILEQQWVTDDISERLQKMTSIVKVSKTKNHVAGSLVHLRTDFNGIFTKSGNQLGATVKNLHPTPAVCGLPRNMAYDFITREEGYDREFYTGYLGPLDSTQNTLDLYVNLRCMKVTEQNYSLYVGGGVTVDSVPAMEWEETQNKLQTMLQVIGPTLSQ
ncbi:MAG: isochorismate synthase [Flavobacteriaceae bacterium]|nr:isochorismate synthase [Flavobacteriaceae bacterium]